MQHEVEINGRVHQVVVHRADNEFVVAVDERARQVNAAHVDPHTLSLIISDAVRLKPDATAKGTATAKGAALAKTAVVSGVSRTYEVTVAPDPTSGQCVVSVAGSELSLGRRTTLVLVALSGRRRLPGKDGAQAGSGPQRIVAPMPGKIVRVLVKIGEAVRARQPLVVVEAMKMENDLRADRDGTVAEIHAREGTSVDAGVLLVVVE